MKTLRKLNCVYKCLLINKSIIRKWNYLQEKLNCQRRSAIYQANTRGIWKLIAIMAFLLWLRDCKRGCQKPEDSEFQLVYSNKNLRYNITVSNSSEIFTSRTTRKNFVCKIYDHAFYHKENDACLTSNINVDNRSVQEDCWWNGVSVNRNATMWITQ